MWENPAFLRTSILEHAVCTRQTFLWVVSHWERRYSLHQTQVIQESCVVYASGKYPVISIFIDSKIHGLLENMLLIVQVYV